MEYREISYDRKNLLKVILYMGSDCYSIFWAKKVEKYFQVNETNGQMFVTVML